MSDIHSDLDHYKDQWEKALKDGFLDSSPHLPPKVSGTSDFFGQWDGGGSGDDGEEMTAINECDAKYWKEVYKLSSHQGQAPLPLYETPTKEDLKTKATRMANSPNPVMPTSLGKDQDVKVAANWTDGKELTELAQLKMRLEKLESQMNAKEGMGQSGSSVQSKIDNLKKQIDELSDSLTDSES